MADDERRNPEVNDEQHDERDRPPPFPPAESESESDADAEAGEDRNTRNPGAIRAEDTEPYLALQYVARLFKIAAMVVIVALVAEVIAGVALEGPGALFPLFTEVIRGIVLAAILWGAGDVTILMIDVGHDVRAARVLLGRLSARQEMEQMNGRDGGI